MKTKITSALAATFTALALSATAYSIPMTGSVEYNLDGSDFSFDGTSVTFAGATNGKVNDAQGDFAGLVGQDVVHADFVYNPFGGTIDPLVTFGGFSFALESVDFFNYATVGAASLLTIVGEGMASIGGFDDTWASWTFTASENTSAAASARNYSATITAANAVPDGGSTLAGLGLAIGTLVVVARKRSRSVKPRMLRA